MILNSVSRNGSREPAAGGGDFPWSGDEAIWLAPGRAAGETLASCGIGARIVLSGRRTAAAPLRRRLEAAELAHDGSRSSSPPQGRSPPPACEEFGPRREAHRKRRPFRPSFRFEFRRNDIARVQRMLTLFPMQLSIFDRPVRIELARTQHGGDVRRGQRKLERPVSTRRPMHVVLKSHRATGPWSLRRHDRTVREVLRRMARRFEIRIYDFANVGSHLHLVLRARSREAFQGFLRSFAGIVARRVMGAERGRRTGRFFDGLAWTRVISWGRDYWGLRHYVFRNQIEGEQGPRIRQAFERGPTRPLEPERLVTPRSPPLPNP